MHFHVAEVMSASSEAASFASQWAQLSLGTVRKVGNCDMTVFLKKIGLDVLTMFDSQQKVNPLDAETRGSWGQWKVD
jgi:hypothetical protein